MNKSHTHTTTLSQDGFSPSTSPREIPFYMTLLRCHGVPVSLMAAGDEVTFSAPIQNGDWYAALTDLDERLCDHQDNNPSIIVLDIISDEIWEVVGLLLEIEGLKQREGDTISDLIFWLSNPTLARQMGRGVQ